ncbi:4789_t:CDS:10 [Entrophospora sp. SA101]|nr:4789_t:CDS:10 [Entrophospora sp. SA101]
MSNSNNIEIDELEINNKRKPIRILTPKEISKAFRIMASRKAERQVRGRYRRRSLTRVFWFIMFMLVFLSLMGAGIGGKLENVSTWQRLAIATIFLLIMNRGSLINNVGTGFASTVETRIILIVLAFVESLTLLTWIIIRFVYPKIIKDANWLDTIWWWRVKSADIKDLEGTNVGCFRYFAWESYSLLFRHGVVTYVGEVDDDGQPHGCGEWVDDSFDGECLVGIWEHGVPIGPFQSRGSGTGDAFHSVRVGLVKKRNILWDEWRFYPKPYQAGLDYVVSSVECSVSGKYLKQLPRATLINPPKSRASVESDLESRKNTIENCLEDLFTFSDAMCTGSDVDGSSHSSVLIRLEDKGFFNIIGYTPSNELTSRDEIIIRKPFSSSPINQHASHNVIQECIIFIHGFNCPPKFATETFGQFLALADFPNYIKPFVFSPSGSNSFWYWEAQKQGLIEEVVNDFKTFLLDLRDSGFSAVHILSHSMGCKLLLNYVKAFDEIFQIRHKRSGGNTSNTFKEKSISIDVESQTISLSSDAQQTPSPSTITTKKMKLSSITLLNPDTSLSQFVNADYQQISKYCNHITVYTNRRDFALRVREFMSKEKSLGRHTSSDLYLEGKLLNIDLIDTTQLDVNIHKLRHNFFNLNRILVDDLCDIIVSGRKANERKIVIHCYLLSCHNRPLKTEKVNPVEGYLEVKKWLNEWYSNLHSRYIDIVSDYGGSELFVLEGDSLLFKILYDPKTNLLDFGKEFSGGQFLALTFLVESFLKQLKDRECVFHIIFFDQHKCIWNNNPKLLLAREIIIDHLKSYKANVNIPIFKFDNWWDEDWRDYINDRQPKKYISSLTNIATEKSLSLTIIWKCLLFHSLHHDLSIALLTGMEFRDSRASAFVADRGGNIKMNAKIEQIIQVIVEVCEASIKIFDEKNSWMKGSVLSFEFPLLDDLLLSKETEKIFHDGGKRMVLVILSLVGVLSTSKRPEYIQLARLFLLHIFILDYLPLKYRAAPPPPPFDDESEENRFMKEFYKFSAKALLSDGFKEITNSIADLRSNLGDFIDGIIFASLIRLQNNGKFSFPREIKNDFDVAWRLIMDLCMMKGHDFSNDENHLLNDKEYLTIVTSNATNVHEQTTTLLPFNFPFFEKYLGNMQLNLSENSSLEIDHGHYGNIGNIPFHDIYHWHKKRLIDAPEPVKDSLRDYQKYVSFMNKYALSLNGTQGFYSIKIIKKNSGKEYKQSNKAKELIEDINKKKMIEKFKISENILDKVIKESKGMMNDKILESLDNMILKKDKFQHPISLLRVHFYKLKVLLDLWTEYCKYYTKSHHKKEYWSKFPVNIFRQIFFIAQNFTFILSENEERKERLIEILNRLGLHDSALNVNTTDARFQMIYAGHLMDRNTNSKDDKRVPNFKPDGWQCEVLDVIDRNESALVCCPTSSGKTFISFYAMKKCLEMMMMVSLLIYVAPTKTLVNQIAAEVYGRFTKDYAHGDRSVWGIYTRDYRHNHDKCQILITVPQILEILLLSPSKYDGWVKRIRRIIFDEVHCIGEMDGGSVWEHLLLLSQCPILALSATIGNPRDFKNWIAKAQEKRGYKMHLIITTKRFSDLKQYVYIPKFPIKPLTDYITKSDKSSQQNSIFPIHPFFQMPTELVAENGLSRDLRLIPSQCIELWDAIKNRVGDDVPDDLKKLDPDEYFTKIGYIVKDDADRYEKELKEIFESWAKDKSKKQLIKNIVSDLSKYIREKFKVLEETAKAKIIVDHETNKQRECSIDPYSDLFIKNTIIQLLFELSAQEKLPAILFHFDRRGCNDLALSVLDQLERAEKSKRENDTEYQIKKKAAIAQKKVLDKANKKNHDNRLSSQELKDLIRSKTKNKPIGDLMGKLLRALERGIGVHHSGLSKKYLQLVEILFRRKHLRVVIATGTLALGINMPCRTAVFCGDSVFLTALQYRQMSGRSGRRGFDSFGNIVFYAITSAKITRLFMSGLPKLTGHFPLTTTLVLRSCNLLTQAIDKNYAEKAISGLLGESFFCLGKEHLSEQIKHHLRFSIEYLMRESLLDKNGQLINLAGIATHLYYTEPSNLAFAVLFKHGTFHEICEGLIEGSPSSLSNKVMNDLMLVMACLFKRIKLRNISHKYYKEQLRKYPSKIFLPPLPEKIKRVLEEHNNRVLNIYTEYVATFAKQKYSDLGFDDMLPLSKLKTSSREFPESTITTDPLFSYLKSIAIPYFARSPFMAMSGSIGDKFSSIYDLSNHIHSKIYIDSYSIPYVETDIELNAYLCDFFSHGQPETLINANGIRPGEVWQKGTQSFTRATTMEAIKFGTKLAIGTQILLEYADEILSFETKPGTNDINVG